MNEQQELGMLSPLNRGFEPIVIDANEDGEFAVVAVWKGLV